MDRPSHQIAVLLARGYAASMYGSAGLPESMLADPVFAAFAGRQLAETLLDGPPPAVIHPAAAALLDTMYARLTAEPTAIGAAS